MKKILFSSIIALITITSFAQNTITKQLNQYITQWQKGEQVTEIKKQLLQFDNEDVLSEIEKFTADTLTSNRYAMYKLLGDIGPKLENQKLRQRVVKQLIFGINDRDGGIVGTNLNALTAFSIDDFRPEAKYLLSEKAKTNSPHYKLLVEICGWLNITDLIYDFRQKIDQKEGTSVQDRWEMRLALSRMGEPDMTDYCLARLKKVKVNDDVVYDFIPDLVYTRQKIVFDYLLTLIESDDKNCTSSNPDSDTKIICAYRIIEQIAPYIEDFPVKTDASGELLTNDYKKMLADVRLWITQNRENYKLNKFVF